MTHSETVQLNGTNIYYEVYGEGNPLFLLHGWTQSSVFWQPYINELSEKFKVYAIDMRGHGRSSILTPDFSIQKAAEDILSLVDHLNLPEIKAIGLSFGGIVLLQMCHMKPLTVESMILIGANYYYSGKDNEALKNFKFEQIDQNFLAQLRNLHPKGDEQIKRMFNPDLNYVIRLTKENLKLITTKTLVISGDHDEVNGLQVAFDLHNSLPKSSLWIVPMAGHVPIFGENQSEFLRIATTFLSQ